MNTTTAAILSIMCLILMYISYTHGMYIAAAICGVISFCLSVYIAVSND